MYITTFYSFKGGVGRTMALVNVAYELIQRGRSVLIVDFDLEALGLDTFDLPRPDRRTLGLVDFVNKYLNTGQSPNVSEFVYQSINPKSDKGSLWIMPSGERSESYPNNFARIDWGLLYDKFDGFLLFEDLKKQWELRINPDYVLIDSRTGHTDIGGICTRQLPNSVVVLFFPNSQNLRGLTRVVRDIRDEMITGRSISIHFVMSNVPDLDDESGILDEIFDSFRTKLEFEGELLKIYRNNSLSLLNQVVFTKDRPRSKLSAEYRLVAKEIMKMNPMDLDGAIYFLDAVRERHRSELLEAVFSEKQSGLIDYASWYVSDVQPFVKRIESNHCDQGEVLLRLAEIYDNAGESHESIEMITRALELGRQSPELYLRRANILRVAFDDPNGASQDALRALESDRSTLFQIQKALDYISPNDFKKVPETRAILRLSSGGPESIRFLWDIARRLDKSKAEAAAATEIFWMILEKSKSLFVDNEVLDSSDIVEFSHSLIASGQFSEAEIAIRTLYSDFKEMPLPFVFDYSMALWAQAGEVNPELFSRAIELHRSIEESEELTEAYVRPEPNYSQCMALASWATGDLKTAREFVDRSRQQITTARTFSCWRYFCVTPREFRRDLNDILELINGDNSMKPLFFPSS